MGDENTIDVAVSLSKDEILSMQNNDENFIPAQQTYQNKVQILTSDRPQQKGFYQITRKNDTLQTVAFNNPKEESLLNYIDFSTLGNLENITIFDSIAAVFEDLNEKNEVQWLWKWFLILAIVSLLLEILILKFYKP